MREAPSAVLGENPFLCSTITGIIESSGTKAPEEEDVERSFRQPRMESRSNNKTEPSSAFSFELQMVSWWLMSGMTLIRRIKVSCGYGDWQSLSCLVPSSQCVHRVALLICLI